MATIPDKVVSELGDLQSTIWQTVSLTVSEACGQSVTFAPSVTEITTPNELMASMSKPKLIIQFAFATLPENSQVLVIDQETFGQLAAFFKGEDIVVANETLISDVRPQFEAFVQGICLAVGNIRNDPMVASGLSVRFQILTLPPNMQRHDPVLMSAINVEADEVNGSILWLVDSETAHTVLNLPMQEDESPTFQMPQAAPSAGGAAPAVSADDPGSIEVLLDIPLEISVELGRVKMLVRDVVDLGSGSIVEIDKAAGEPVDVLVNGRLVARGEVVVIEDNFGVRLTEIMSPQDRLNRLNEVA